MKLQVQWFVFTSLLATSAGWLTSCKKNDKPSSPSDPAGAKFLLVAKTDSSAVQESSPGHYDVIIDKTLYSYDGKGRLAGSIDSLKQNHSDGRTELTVAKETYTYNADGFLVSSTDDKHFKFADGSETAISTSLAYEYTNGRVTKYFANGGTVNTFAYDDAGRLIKYTTPSDTMTYQYSSVGMTKMMQKDIDGITSYDIKTDAQGRILQLKGADGEEDVSYDASGDMLDVVYKVSGQVVMHHSMTYDDKKYVLGFTDLWTANKGFPRVDYLDPTYIILGVDVPKTNFIAEKLDIPGSTQDSFQAAYNNTYDKDGNLIMQQQTGAPSPQRPIVKSVFMYTPYKPL
jgi:YD repeat-containing protein